MKRKLLSSSNSAYKHLVNLCKENGGQVKPVSKKVQEQMKEAYQDYSLRDANKVLIRKK